MFSRLIVWLVPLALTAVRATGFERNAWPLAVEQESAVGTPISADYLGPLFFTHHLPGQPARQGFRPFYLQTEEPGRETIALFYPLFVWEHQGDYRAFSFFQLFNHSQDNDAQARPLHRFDIWPFYFSRTTSDPDTTYRALFPLGGVIKERFGQDRIQFVLFPLYAHTEKNGRHITHAPWPLLRFINGAGHHGFEFWPLFGHRNRPDDYDQRFYLWPLFYKSARDLAASTPTVSIGVLPFYTRDTAAGYRSENYLWPFFGSTRRTEPYRYAENRYFWPFLIQGQGEQRRINRWAPIYTHSTIKGLDKTWLFWPLFRHARWAEEGAAQEKSQFFFFVYWSLTQQSLANPAAPPAHKRHLWPLLSAWDNGAGRQQWQLFSPLEVFFPQNDTVRQLYSPLFALYRYDRQDKDTVRRSWLWNAATYQHTREGSAFHLGPVLAVTTTAQKERITLGRGLLGLQRSPGQRIWHPFLFDFSAEKRHQSITATQP